jgi:hypothetical protein
VTLEADIENAFVTYAESQGCEAYKLRIDGTNGFPDRTILIPGGWTLFIEFKKPGGSLRPAQKKTIKRLLQLGHAVHVCDSFEDAKQILDQTLKGGES